MQDYSTLPLFSLQPETKEIPLTQGKFAIVSATDYDWLMQWKWCAHRNGHLWYAERPGPMSNGKYKGIKMHRFILGAPDGQPVDHKDGDGLNNTRANLRLCTYQQNRFNTTALRNSESRFKGVTRLNGAWRAELRLKDRRIYMGCFATEEEAARAYDKAAKEIHGEFARLNFPEKEDKDE